MVRYRHCVFALICALSPWPNFAQNVTIDDSSSELTFGGGIATNCNVGNKTVCAGIDCPDPTKLLDGTWHDCGLNPALSFSFTGTAFWIFGVVPDSPLGPPFPMNISTDGNLSSGNDISSLPPHTYNVSLGSVTGLNFGNHTVSVAGAVAGSAPHYLLIDYVVIDVTPPTISAASSGVTGTTSSTQPPQTSSPSSSSTSGSSNIGAIAGGVAAGVVVLLITAAFIFFVSRRRKRKSRASSLDLLDHSDEGSSHPAIQMQSVNYHPEAQSQLSSSLPEASLDNLPPYSDEDPAAPSSVPNPSPFNLIASPGHGSPEDPQTPRIHPSLIIHNRSESSTTGSSSTSRGKRRDAFSSWVEAHRQEISPEMEQSLRRAGYQPGQDPDRMSAEQWSNLGIGAFSLQILKDIYKASRPVRRQKVDA